MKTTRVVLTALAVGLLLGIPVVVCAQTESSPTIELLPAEAPADETPGAITIPLESVPEELMQEEEAPAELPEMEAAETLDASEAVEAPAADEPAEAPAEEVVVPASPAAENPELIELDTERELPSGADVSKGEQGTELITITLDNVPLQDVIRMFTRISGANIVAGTNLQGNVTVSLQNVEWKPAMQVILDSVNMALVEKRPGIYSVMSKAELASEPVTMDTIYLRYATVSNVVPIVERMLISSNASVAGFASANAIVVQETAARLTTIKDVISRLDKPRPQVIVEAKFVELNDRAIKDLGINWQVLQNYSVGLKYGWEYASLNDKTSRKSDSLVNSYSRTLFDSTVDQSLDSDSSTASDSSFSGSDVFGDVFGTVPNAPTITYGSLNESLDTSTRNRSSSEQDYSTDTRSDSTTRDDTRTHSKTEDTINQTSDLLAAILTADELKVTLSALKQNSGVTIVSNPKILVASGETAGIHVGINTPNVAVTIDKETKEKAYGLDTRQPFIETGVKVSVTPVVNTDSNISVRITPELSRILGYRAAGDGSVSFPETSIRRVVTDFSLENGRTAA